MPNVANNYFRILSVLNSLNLKLTKTSKVDRPPKMSDLEVIALSFTAEYLSIDSENALFNFIEKELIDNLLERSQFNKRRRQLFDFSEQARQKLASVFLSFEDCFIIDSMPIEICKPARMKHLIICREEQRTAPTKGYCASQKSTYYGYKLHGICS
ncbi:MAG TPA: IS982 family transposase, partial [Emticicia sp.]